MTLETLMDRMVYAPRKRFGIPLKENDYSVWDVREAYEIDPEDFLSKGKATPFAGWKVYGKCVKTVCDGKIVFENK